MKAAVYHGPGSITWDEVARPALQDDTDAVVRVDATTICGTDLHILKGDLPASSMAGSSAMKRSARSRRLVARSKTSRSATGCSCHVSLPAVRADSAATATPGQCLGGGGWILGYQIDGTQAEFVRVPFADNSTYPVPAGVSDESVLMLADILPTAYEVGVLNAKVRPGDVVAVVGAGPIGLSAILGAKLFSPSIVVAIDKSAVRLEAAKQFGADLVVNNSEQDPIGFVRDLTAGLGADIAIEAVGAAATFELAVDLVRPGGHVANIGVHGAPATLHLERIWDRDLTITTGLVDAYSTATLLRLVANGDVDPSRFVTHTYALADCMTAYDTFGRAAETGALKVVLIRAGVV